MLAVAGTRGGNLSLLLLFSVKGNLQGSSVKEGSIANDADMQGG